MGPGWMSLKVKKSILDSSACGNRNPSGSSRDRNVSLIIKNLI